MRPTKEKLNWYRTSTFDKSSAVFELMEEIDALTAELEQARKELAHVQWWHRKPTHGPCCTCQRCGMYYDDCKCDLEEVTTELAAAKREIERLKEKNNGRQNQTT